MAKLGRNKPCWCGSGIKYKKCHYPLMPNEVVKNQFSSDPFELAVRQSQASEELRRKQQGLGRPIIGTEYGGYQLVAAGNTLHFSKKWKTFPDFLFDYIADVFGSEWFAEAQKAPPESAHVLIVWFNSIVALQEKAARGLGKLFSAEMTGAVYCYLGLAYGLYLLKHNAELQSRLVSRLKDMKQFQGAYYEVIVANCLIRAGFELTLEDEADGSSKHCEFSAISNRTGEKYWVEAKMRSVSGLLGKTSVDSVNSDDPTSRIPRHIAQALKKPAPDKRIIFVDVNAEPLDSDKEPEWSPAAYARLEKRERHLKRDESAYVFVTNFPYHRALESAQVSKAVLAFGLGISDFAKVGPVKLPQWYRSKQRHADAFDLLESMRSYPQLPETFDGRPAAELAEKGSSSRLFVGQEYYFEGTEGNGTVGVVKQVLVHERSGNATVVVRTRAGDQVMLEVPLSPAESDAYRKYGGAYFGELVEQGRNVKDEFELFEFFVEKYKETPKERLLEIAKDHPRIDELKKMDHESLVLAICEAWVLKSRDLKSRN